jgi:Secretion system C-terminal sorting domain
MMKQIILFSSFFLNFNGFASAQNAEFAPVNAYWRYDFTDSGGPGYATLKVVGDTIVNGKTYRNLYLYANNYLNTPQRITYTHFGMLDLRNDSVFLISRQNNLRFLYSFKQRIGDTIFIQNSTTQQQYVVADSVKTENILGRNRRVVYFTKHCQRTTAFFKERRAIRLVENVGLVEDIMDWGSFGCGILETRYYTATCYQSGSAKYPSNAQNCEPISAVNEAIANKITVSPNPATSDLQFNYPSELQLNKVELLNYLGQTISVSASSDKQKVNVSNVPNGIYFLRLSFDNQQVVKEIIVQH